MTPLSILLIDDHALFRSGLRMIIESKFDDVTVLEADSLEQVLGMEAARPHIVLLDVRLPGLNGLESIALLKRRWEDVPIVMLSSDASNITIQRALERGAVGFVSKADKPEVISSVIEAHLLPHKESAHSFPNGQTSFKEHPELTPRQSEVLVFLGQGLPNKSIARKLHISENTVRGHVQSLLTLFNANSRSEAVYIARRLSLLD